MLMPAAVVFFFPPPLFFSPFVSVFVPFRLFPFLFLLMMSTEVPQNLFAKLFRLAVPPIRDASYKDTGERRPLFQAGL